MGARSRSRRTGGSRPPDGQHFLRSRLVAAELVRDARVGPGDHVLEIGAGGGRLTAALASCAHRVTAVELDTRYAGLLRRAFSNLPHVAVIEADILRVPLPSEPYRAFGNIPFGITNAILRRLLDEPAGPLDRADLLVQFEVARKRTAVWPSTLLSLGWLPWWELVLTRRIPRHGFEPPPSVDAGLFRITRRDPALLPVEARPAYVGYLRRAFDRPSWPVRRTFRAELPPMTWKRLARERGIPVDAAPRQLDIFDWIQLHATLSREGR